MKSEGLRRSQQQENRLANTLGGSVNAASGAFWLRKGDVRTNDLLIEAKWTGKKTYTLKASTLEEAMGEAILSGRVGVLCLELNGKNYVVMDEEDFHELHRKALGDS